MIERVDVAHELEIPCSRAQIAGPRVAVKPAQRSAARQDATASSSAVGRSLTTVDCAAIDVAGDAVDGQDVPLLDGLIAEAGPLPGRIDREAFATDDANLAELARHHRGMRGSRTFRRDQRRRLGQRRDVARLRALANENDAFN